MTESPAPLSQETASSHETVIAAIVFVAPEAEADLRSHDHSSDVFESLGLDSMDHLAVVTEIAARTGIEISEREYGHLRSINALAEHVHRET